MGPVGQRADTQKGNLRDLIDLHDSGSAGGLEGARAMRPLPLVFGPDISNRLALTGEATARLSQSFAKRGQVLVGQTGQRSFDDECCHSYLRVCAILIRDAAHTGPTLAAVATTTMKTSITTRLIGSKVKGARMSTELSSAMNP